MANPCVADTTHIVLTADGSPATLEADFANVAGTGSATQGDDTTHVVTDNDTPHIQTQTFVVDNSAGVAVMSGIVVVALNPIWAGLPDGPGCSLIYEASLTIHGSLADQRDTITQPLVEDEVLQFYPGSLVGEISVPAGASHNVVWEKRITNDGASVQWSFRMGGDKAVYMKNFG